MTTIQIATADNDDATQRESGTNYARNGGLFTRSGSTAGDRYQIGLRGTNATIPPGALIQAARVDLWCTFSTFDDARCDISCEAEDDPVGYPASAGTDDVNDRARTTATVNWNELNLGGPGYVSSPDISEPVQEVVDRPGWASGNAIGVLLDGSNDVTSYWIWANDGGDAGNEPQIFVTYVQLTTTAYRYRTTQARTNQPSGRTRRPRATR